MEKTKKNNEQLYKEGKLKKQKEFEVVKNEEIPYEIPQGWIWDRIGNTGIIFNGDSLNSKQKECYSNCKNGLPYISTKHVGYGSKITNYKVEMKIPYDEPKFRIAHSNSVLICSEGGSAGKKIGLIDRDICFGNKLYANETFLGITPNYIYYFYQTPFFFYEFKKRMTGIIGGISINSFINIPIPIPPTLEQKRIVAKVDELMALCDELEKKKEKQNKKRISLNNASLDKLLKSTKQSDFNYNFKIITDNFDIIYNTPENVKNLKQAILQLAVQGKLVPQDPNDEPASVLLKKIKNEKEKLIKEGKIKKQEPLPEITEQEKPFELPKGWECCRLGNVTNYALTQKIEPSSLKSEIWVLELEDIEKETSRIIKKMRFAERQSKSTKNVFNTGDVIYGKLRPYLDKVIIADEPGVCTTEMIPVNGYGFISPQYLRWFLKSPYFIEYANSSTHGMKMPRLGTDRALNSICTLPPLNEQKRIVAKVDELMALCDNLENKLTSISHKSEKMINAIANKIGYK
ncbi:restriction endonuclease subunit S [Candidatus Desantisbacteria bacterium]|nr:restriction endonuclease subunit S [Candidatus Desantisbacteria bacterium]